MGFVKKAPRWTPQEYQEAEMVTRKLGEFLRSMNQDLIFFISVQWNEPRKKLEIGVRIFKGQPKLQQVPTVFMGYDVVDIIMMT